MNVPARVALLGAAALLGLGAWFLRSGDRSPAETPPPRSSAAAEAASDRSAPAAAEPPRSTRSAPADAAPLPPDELARVAPQEARREAAVRNGPHGTRILTADGRPAEGAVLTWTPISELLVYSTWDWDEIDQDWWTAATMRATADAQGHVAAEPPALDDGLGSIVWIDVAGHEATVDALEPEVASLAGRTYRLTAAPGVRVRVVDVHGRPVEGAVVEQHGVALDDVLAAPAHAPLLFVRSRTTDERGACRASRFPGRQALVARHGDRVSRPVLVDARRDEVELVLRESFTISGTVTRPVSQEVPGEIIPRVTIGVRKDNLVVELATAVSRGDGRWGPIAVPLLPPEEASEYEADVHGVLVLPNVTPFPAPAPGEHVTLHLDAEAGAVHWFLAFDQKEDVPLPGTTTTVSWIEEDGRTRSVTTPGRPDGHTFVLGIRPGVVHATITRPGYCPGILTAVEVPAPTPVALSVVMHPSAQVSGRVVRNGEPVPDFELTAWPSADVAYRTTQVFHDRVDGSFTIEASSDETLGIVAAAPGAPGSVPLQVQVPATGLEGVEIELVDALRGSGRVVAASSGETLTEALVQPHVTGAGRALTPWGPPLPVGADGSFAGAAFRSGANRLIVSAPGFAASDVYAESDGGAVDFGVIELKPAAHLRVEVEAAIDGRHTLDLLGPTPRTSTEFERDDRGLLVAVLADVPEGKRRIQLYYPDRQSAARDVEIAPGSNVTRIRGGTGTLTATIHGELPNACSLSVEMQDPSGAQESFFGPRSTEKDRRIVRLPAGEARVYLRDYAATYATTIATIAEGRETHVELTIRDTALVVRVLDDGEDPVPGARVLLYGTEHVAERHGGMTDERGVLVLSGLHRGTYVLHVTHPTIGLAPPREIELVDDEEVERDVLLDGRATLDLRIFDEDVALPGIRCRLRDARGNDLSPVVLSNAEGRAQVPRLTPGAYRLQVASETIWPLELDLDVQPGAGPRTIEVRRLGDLLLRALSPDGLPVSGLEVELTDVESGESLQAWLDAGRVVGPDELATDLRGEIALQGLPRGVYAWRAGSAEGSAVVKAGEETLAFLADG